MPALWLEVDFSIYANRRGAKSAKSPSDTLLALPHVGTLDELQVKHAQWVDFCEGLRPFCLDSQKPSATLIP